MPLPELIDTVLESDTLRALFDDYAACVTQLSAHIRSGRGEPVQPLSAAHVCAGLLDGRFRGAQIRYTYNGEAWCDSILATAQGYRLVRISDTAIAASVQTELDAPSA